MTFGQVHGPYVREVGNQKLVCGASVSVNWDGDNRPAYVILEYHVKDNAVVPNVLVMAVCPKVRRAHVEFDISEVDDAAIDGYARMPEVRAGASPSQAGMENADGRAVDGH